MPHSLRSTPLLVASAIGVAMSLPATVRGQQAVGDVRVVNRNNQPVPVRDRLIPFVHHIESGVGPFTTPNNRTLLLEQIHLVWTAPNVGSAGFARIDVTLPSGKVHRYYFPPTNSYDSGGVGGDFVVAHEALRIYVPGGSSVFVTAVGLGPEGQLNGQFLNTP
jgi:hypothetical protein